MTWLDALVVGLFQVLAVFPGASRSGTTVSGGMLRGLDRPSAARFAFLLSVPVLLAAGVYEMPAVLRLPDAGSFVVPLAVGFAAAAVFGWLAIGWLISYLNRRSLYVFAAYCAAAGAACVIVS
jgi:undecaprenyl-diphosphatase